MHACERGERAGARNAAKFKHALHITERLYALLDDTATSSTAAAEARLLRGESTDGDAASDYFWAKASSCSFNSNYIDILSMRWSACLLQLAAHSAFITPLRAISLHRFCFVTWCSESEQEEAPPRENPRQSPCNLQFRFRMASAERFVWKHSHVDAAAGCPARRQASGHAHCNTSLRARSREG